MSSDFNWLDEDLSGFGVAQSDSHSPPLESLILKSPPEIQPPEKLTFKSSFNVETYKVKDRLRKAIWPFKYDIFFDKGHPDLYSPFWISTTLILLICIISQISKIDISIFIKASIFIYSIVSTIPAILYFFIYQNTNCDYYTLLSYYGYSYIHFIIANLLSVYPNTIFRFFVWTQAGIMSLLFLYKNLNALKILTIPNQKYLVAGILFIGHLIVILTTNFFLY